MLPQIVCKVSLCIIRHMHKISESLAATAALATKEHARALCFDACGIASADAPIDPDNNLRAWIASGYQADMTWMKRSEDLRSNVQAKLPGTRSVVVVARNYYSERPQAPSGSARVSRYAWGRDYHKVLKKPLRELARFIECFETGTRTYASVDTGPVLERAWARRAGVGSIGKHSLALRRDIGSWFFLGTILTTLELEHDPPAEDICGTCRLCIDACPTAAIVEPRVVDSNRCISYHTIENRGGIPDGLQAEHGDWVFGCDVCQEVCPWNRFETETTERDFHPRGDHANPDLDRLLELDEDAFNEEFAGTTILRTKHSGMMRNASIAKSNRP